MTPAFRVRALLVAGVAAVTLGGCYSGPSADDSTYQGTRYPLGVLRPTQDHPDLGVVAGIYPAATSDDPFCCWMAENSAFEVRVAPRANTLVVATFLPALAVFDGRQQTVDISVEGAPAKHFAVHKGINFLRVPIRASSTERVADVAMTAGFSFSPKSQKINGDTRKLSMYVKAVRSERR